jgi:hypothetical protein
LKELYLYGCEPDDLPPEVCGKNDDDNVLDKVRTDCLRRGSSMPGSRRRLCRKLAQERWNLIRDKGALDYGDQISDFMKTLGQARLVIVVLSNKYLRSPYCMTELYALYQNARQERQEFLNRIIPLANIGNWLGRATYAERWDLPRPNPRSQTPGAHRSGRVIRIFTFESLQPSLLG